MQDYAGSRIIVTGSASGMGDAVMAGLVAHGANAVGLDISHGEGLIPGNPALLRCHVSDKASVDTAVDAAGVAPGAPAESIHVDDWDRVFAVNARGTMLTNQAAFRHLRDRGADHQFRIWRWRAGAGQQDALFRNQGRDDRLDAHGREGMGPP